VQVTLGKSDEDLAMITQHGATLRNHLGFRAPHEVSGSSSQGSSSGIISLLIPASFL
jgi:hypothetical protein